MALIDDHFAKVSALRDDIQQRLTLCEAHEAATADVFSTTNAIRARAHECLLWTRNEIDSFREKNESQASHFKLQMEDAEVRINTARVELEEAQKERVLIGTEATSPEHQAALNRLESTERVLEARIKEWRRQFEVFESVHSTAVGAYAVTAPAAIPGLEERNSWLQDIQRQADALWKELETKKRLDAALKSDFESKSQSFLRAEEHHRKEASRLLYFMGAIVVLSGFAILRAFSVDGGPSQAPSGNGWERLVFVFGGRIALLLLVAWTIRFVGGLHRAHSEQAVIYQDRQAALGIVQSMINTSSDAEYRREVLKILAEGYLNFELSAFRIGASPVVKEGDAIGREIKHVKKAVDAIKPIFDSVTKVAEKAVEKSK